MQEDVLATIDPAGPRRWLGIGTLLVLGGMLLYLAFAVPPATIGWQVLLVVLGGGALWFAQRMQVATTVKLILTETELRDSNGTLITTVEDIVRVERGMLAFKPSNGFMLRTRTALPRAWHPGLWWRSGKKVAIGGVTSGRQTKPMADILAILVAKRDGD